MIAIVPILCRQQAWPLAERCPSDHVELSNGVRQVSLTMSSDVRDNTDRHRFELERNGQIAFATYERRGSDLVIRHVEAAIPLRGTGAAGELMKGVAEIARSEGRKITPLCGYAFAWIRRHKEYSDLLN
ncbi:N-acetyltransferase [Microvirga arabica]|nr:N-acetyltransferase [Microvirga arabica]